MFIHKSNVVNERSIFLLFDGLVLFDHVVSEFIQKLLHLSQFCSLTLLISHAYFEVSMVVAWSRSIIKRLVSHLSFLLLRRVNRSRSFHRIVNQYIISLPLEVVSIRRVKSLVYFDCVNSIWVLIQGWCYVSSWLTHQRRLHRSMCPY